MATMGTNPLAAMPAASVTPCSSQMPTSNTRSGNARAAGSNPVASHIAAVIATSRSSCFMSRSTVCPKTSL